MTDTETVTTAEVMIMIGRSNLGSTRGWLHTYGLVPLPWRTPDGQNVYNRAAVQAAIDSMPRGPYRNRPPRPPRRARNGNPTTA